MNRNILKIAILALVAVGMLSISSCKKEEENNTPTTNNRITLGEIGSVWQCSTEHYTITWTLLNDSTIYSEVEKDSGYYAGFGDEIWYNYYIEKDTERYGLNSPLPLLRFPRQWDNNNDTLGLGDYKCYLLNLSNNQFRIDDAEMGPRPGKSSDSYLFKKIK